MPIATYRLIQAATAAPSPIVKSITEARARRLRVAFLCHSHSDKTLALGLVNLLAKSGWNVYVDWQDPSMPPVPSRETAKTIQTRIQQADYFLFLATEASLGSRWCPWEIGYADGVKPLDSILVVPTRSADGTEHGSEYLALYRRVDISLEGSLGVWRPGERSGVLLTEV